MLFLIFFFRKGVNGSSSFNKKFHFILYQLLRLILNYSNNECLDRNEDDADIYVQITDGTGDSGVHLEQLYTTRAVQQYTTRAVQQYTTRAVQLYTRAVEQYTTRAVQQYTTRTVQQYTKHMNIHQVQGLVT